MICQCQWLHAENTERRVIDVENHNLNTANSTDCDDIRISDNAANELIATAVNDGDLTNFS